MDAVIREIRDDLLCFSDPGRGVEVDTGGALWVQDGEERTLNFLLDQDSRFPRVRFKGSEMAYRDFLAGPAMANLTKLAKFIQNVVSRTPVHVETSSVGTEDDDSTEAAARPTTELVQQLATQDLPFGATRVVLLQGEAGSGKTIALRELTLQRAGLFERREAGSLFFYVNAQGRALSRIEDAIAKDLDDLRASFPYAAVAPLTRHGLLIPIIDGFDELLGSGGYDEAFSSLAALISTLDRRGSLVASARSAFFDYRSFRENAQKFAHSGSLNYELQTVRVRPWDSRQQELFASRVAMHRGRNSNGASESFRRAASELNETDRKLLGKPFYLSKFVDLLLAGDDIGSEGQLLDVLVDAFLEREHAKLKAKEDVPLLSLKGHRAFLSEIADDMWWQESRRVDLSTLQAIAELIAEKFGLPPASAGALIARVSSYPFLTTDQSERKWYRFEHEVFYGYFLAHRLRECLEDETADLRRFLNRAVADDSLIAETARLVGYDVSRVKKDIHRLSTELKESLTEATGRENGGALAAALVAGARDSIDGLRFKGLVFNRVSFGSASLVEPTFQSCDFDGVDLTCVSFQRPVFEHCVLRAPVIDADDTRMDGATTGILEQIHGVILNGGHVPGVPIGETYEPDHVRAVLRAIGVVIPDKVTTPTGYSPSLAERVRLLDRFLRKMERRYFASEDDIKRFSFASGKDWEAVWEFLETSNLIEGVQVQKSGRAEPLIKLSVPPEIIRRGEDTSAEVPGRVREFWSNLRSTA